MLGSRLLNWYKNPMLMCELYHVQMIVQVCVAVDTEALPVQTWSI